MYKEILSNKSIAISISENSDMPILGFDVGHLNDAMAEIARHLLALGARLVYGGDLRENGFSNLLFELVARHSRDAIDNEKKSAVTNYMAWPVHLNMTHEYIENVSNDLSGAAELSLLTVKGKLMASNKKRVLPLSEPSEDEWKRGLTAMRRFITNETFARIVVGGRTEGYRGNMPGVAEEIFISLKKRKPIYILGGFGGCARDVAEAIGLVDSWRNSKNNWDGLDRFNSSSKSKLNNGLTEAENSILARTPHVDQAIALVLKGLVTLIARPQLI